MGIFGSIRDAIFGTAQANAAAQAGAADAGSAASTEAFGTWTPGAPVDVGAVLREKMTAKGSPALNYETSIVDLMKLLDLDSSLAARGQLADELGYTGAKDGSVEMNLWLHRKVMEELGRNGGLVPESMKS